MRDSNLYSGSNHFKIIQYAKNNCKESLDMINDEGKIQIKKIAKKGFEKFRGIMKGISKSYTYDALKKSLN